MKRLSFDVQINATASRVWNILWNDANYRKWTSEFSPGSHAVTDWNEGSKVLFLSGEKEGMVSRISTKKPGEFMLFEHLGTVRNGVEDLDCEETKKWSGATESYRLTENNGHTNLHVEMDSLEDHADYFNNTFPKALHRVKEMAEQGSD